MTSVRPEYPRPHFDRSHSWVSLNGEWDFLRDPEGSLLPGQLAGTASPWAEQIVVPFAWETKASEVEAQWLACGWYRRELAVPTEWDGQRIILHFGAVHHQATVWVNGTEVGSHEGGYTPFEIDVTDALGGNHNVVLVRVSAPLDKRYIVHGKQRSIPRDDYDNCAFSPSSGIWQSVWAEARPATYLADIQLRPSDGLDRILASLEASGSSVAGARLRVSLDGVVVIDQELSSGATGFTIPITAPRLWTAADPHLYEVTAELTSDDGIDSVTTHTGLRKIEVVGNTLVLNGERLYVRGVLDQGYWPGSGITAPTDEAFVRDIEIAREAGFTVIRKHLKLEDPRFLFHADRLGMLVWAEPASTGRYSREAASRFEEQIEPMVRRDGNHPSIVIWGLYNEEWGLDWDVANDPEKQDAVRHAFDLLKELDPSRPTVDNSGWSHVSTDIVDWHIYDETPAGWADKMRHLLADRDDNFPVGIGPGIVVDKPLVAVDPRGSDDKPNLNSEFGGGFTSVERGWNLRWQTLELRAYDRLSGYVWTELYDVEHEMAGLFDAERSLKDTGGTTPAAINADTVVVPKVLPEAPGRDVVAGPSGEVAFDIHISHHGAKPIAGRIVTAWGAQLGSIAPSELLSGSSLVAETAAQPFRLSEAVRVTATLPEGWTSGRLHVAFIGEDSVVAVTPVDVVR